MRLFATVKTIKITTLALYADIVETLGAFTEQFALFFTIITIVVGDTFT